MRRVWGEGGIGAGKGWRKVKKIKSEILMWFPMIPRGSY